jgi:hypothetical protein
VAPKAVVPARPPVSAKPATQPAATAAPPQLSFSFSGMSPYPCGDEGSIHSAVSYEQVPVVFTNDSSESLQVIWLNTSGNRVLYDTLSPGNSYSADTYVGHVWEIAGYSAACQGIFAVNGAASLTVTAS